jgi:hypothetical protein
VHPLDRLADVDAAALGTGLPPAHARAVWTSAIDGARAVRLDRPLPGTAPRVVTIVASANVFTAPVEWCWALSQRGVRVLLKSARGLAPVGEALAAALPGVEARAWVGGDLDAEAAALGESDAAMVFGGADTLRAIRARSPVPVLGFGPRFGITCIPALDAALAPRLARDHALYDGRGCMSPAAVFVDEEPDLEVLRSALAEADERYPPGPLVATEASERRALAALARVEGRALHEGSWLVVALPPARFRPRGLPRVVIVHRGGDRAAAVAPWREELGTIALAGAREADVGERPDVADGLGLAGLPPARVCAVGEAQRPPGSRRLHDGVDVLAALWRVGGG